MSEESLIFYDTDCLSCFLYVNNVFLPKKVFPEACFYVPYNVDKEIRRNKNSTFINRYLIGLGNKDYIVLPDIDACDEENLFRMYTELTNRGLLHKDIRGKIIGPGEAEAFARAKLNSGILASNNLKDVKSYCEDLHVELLTTADILVKSVDRFYCTEQEAGKIWSDMVDAGQLNSLPCSTFNEYYKEVKKEGSE